MKFSEEERRQPFASFNSREESTSQEKGNTGRTQISAHDSRPAQFGAIECILCPNLPNRCTGVRTFDAPRQFTQWSGPTYSHETSVKFLVPVKTEPPNYPCTKWSKSSRSKVELPKISFPTLIAAEILIKIAFTLNGVLFRI